MIYLEKVIFDFDEEMTEKEKMQISLEWENTYINVDEEELTDFISDKSGFCVISLSYSK